MRFHIHWLENMDIAHYDEDDLRSSLDKGTTFKNNGQVFAGEDSYEVEFDHYFDKEDIVGAIEYTKKYVASSAYDIEVFSLIRDEVLFTEENL